MWGSCFLLVALRTPLPSPPSPPPPSLPYALGKRYFLWELELNWIDIDIAIDIDINMNINIASMVVLMHKYPSPA